MSAQESDSFNSTEQENPLLVRVRETLYKTDPEKWQQFGSKLDPEAAYPKAVEKHEHVLHLEIKAGTLVLRASTPVLSQFHNGGYTLTPTAPTNFTTELRERLWDPRELGDPGRRGNPKEKKLEVLAERKVAGRLFNEQLGRLTEYHREKTRIFDEGLAEVLKELESLVNKGVTSAWQKKVEGKGTVTWYSAEILSHNIAVGRQIRKDGNQFKLVITNSESLSKSYDSQLAKLLFEAVEFFEQNEGLARLSNLLDDL